MIRYLFFVLLFSPLCLEAQQQSINIAGRQIYFDVAGAGPPLLMFHGWTQTAEDWKPLLRGLESSYQVIYVDMPGHGRSGDLPENFSVQQTAQLMSEFVEVLQLRGARAIGYSFGGMVVLEMLVQNPRTFREAVIISTPYSFDGASQQPMTLDSLPESYRSDLISKHSGGINQVKKLFDPGLNYKIDLDESQIRPIFIPVFIIQGEKDVITPPGQGKDMHRWLQSGQLWIVRGKGHNAVTTDNKSDFVKRVGAFFAEF